MFRLALELSGTVGAFELERTVEDTSCPSLRGRSYKDAAEIIRSKRIKRKVRIAQHEFFGVSVFAHFS
jgi:hypothetical protein